MTRTIRTSGPRTTPVETFSCDGVSARLAHIDGDPDSVFRFYIKRENCSVELCPSKGLSVRDTELSSRQIFWDAPLPNLPNPRDIDLEGTMMMCVFKQYQEKGGQHSVSFFRKLDISKIEIMCLAFLRNRRHLMKLNIVDFSLR